MAVGQVFIYKLEEVVDSSIPEGRVLEACGRYGKSVGHSASGEGLQNAAMAFMLGPLLHVGHMQMTNIKGLARSPQNYAAEISLPESVLLELRWWIMNLKYWNGKSIINPDPELDLMITSDASKKGWGAECEGFVMQGQWSLTETGQHINVLELKAVGLAIKSLKHLWQGGCVCLRLNNMTAVAQLLKMWPLKSSRCLIVTQEIWECVLLYHRSTITAQYLPGKELIIANNQRRMFRDNSSWMLDLQGLKALLGLFPFLLVDLSADRLNHQLTHFWSWRPDPLAEDVDSLTTVWKGMDVYVFPPFQLIHKILTKVQNEGAAVLVVAPVWFQQAWHPVLLGILVELLVLLPASTQISTAPDSSPHPMNVNQSIPAGKHSLVVEVMKGSF